MDKFPSETPEEYRRQQDEEFAKTTDSTAPDFPADFFDRQAEMASFDTGPDSLIKKPLERVKKYLRILLAGAILTSGGKMAYEKYEEHTEEKATIEYVKSSGLLEIAEKSGFDLKVDVANGDGPYIAHIGYMHSYKLETPSAELLNELLHDAILQNNQDSERLLIALKEKNEPRKAVVFTEGYDEKSIGFFEFISAEKNKITAIGISEGAIGELSDIISGLPPKEKLPKVARTSFEYLVSKKLSELSLNGISLDNKRLAVLKSICEKKLGSFDLRSINERILKEGSALKLYIDGQYQIVPAENSEVIDEIRQEEATLSNLSRKLGELAKLAKAGSKEASEKYGKLAFQYIILKERLHKDKVLSARENYAVKLIRSAAAAQKADRGVISMLYGASHDFSDNVKENNRLDGGTKIGLITFLPKGYKGERE